MYTNPRLLLNNYFCREYDLLHAALGSITVNEVSLAILSSSFTAIMPVIKLIGLTRGGPPAENGWTLNGRTITNVTSFRINTEVHGSSLETYLMAIYVSSLTVTGRYPGTYSYFANNRATEAPLTASIDITST